MVLPSLQLVRTDPPAVAFLSPGPSSTAAAAVRRERRIPGSRRTQNGRKPGRRWPVSTRPARSPGQATTPGKGARSAQYLAQQTDPAAMQQYYQQWYQQYSYNYSYPYYSPYQM
ncbi:hypothetical protein chiPu_0022687, partial [Chiloscyllium punctatum]|nr:hypothetical protein [Chiloscyllium punctatum]